MKKKIIVVCILLVVLLCIPIYLLKAFYPQKIKRLSLEDYVVSTSLLYEIEDAVLQGNELSISGWVLYPGQSQKYNRYNRYIFFIDENSGNTYYIRVNSPREKRTDVTEYMNDGVDYRESGFTVTLNLDWLPDPDGKYSLYICYQYNGQNLLGNINTKIENRKLLLS